MLPPSYFFIMLMAALTLVLLRSRRLFDDVLSALHRDHLELWESAGKPIGFFWIPEDDSLTWKDSMKARKALFKAYMQDVPEWMADEQPLQIKLLWSRIYLLMSYAGYGLAGLGLLYFTLLG